MKKIVKINSLILILVIIFNVIFPIVSIATENTVTITFQDENLYKAILEINEEKIESSEDETYTIKISQSNLESITSLNLAGENITNIYGIEKFTNIIGLNLYNNNISDILPLRELKELKYLDLTMNNITEITALESLTELTELYLGTDGCVGMSHNGGSNTSTNKIEDIKPLENLTNLIHLEIQGLGLIDISSLNKLINLSTLAAGFNNITDVSAIRNLVNLKGLSLDNNKIQNANVLSELTNLKVLSLNDNNISDIAFLEKMSDLEILNLSHNNISNIATIGMIENLTELSLGDNENLFDISPLANCSELKIVYLPNNSIETIECLNELTDCQITISNNSIDDLNVIDNTNIDFSSSYYYEYYFLSNTYDREGRAIKAHPQYLSLTTRENEVQLPKIFLQAKDVNSKCYTKEEFQLINCTLSEDGKSIILNEWIGEATIKIVGGNISGSILNINAIDEKAPNLNVIYNPTQSTNRVVTATIVANEPIQQVEGWFLQDDGRTLTKVYAKNTVENVDVYDLAGNKSTAKIEITNIDKIAPEADIQYSTTKLTNKNVIVTIIANEQIQNVDGWTISNDKKTLTKEFANNVEESVSIYDLAGNERKIPIKVSNIDKVAPSTEIEYSTKELTNDNIRVTISSNEEIQEIDGRIISSDRKTLTKEYEKNKEEEITIYDLAGNGTKNQITISNIDKDPPKLEIIYNTVEKTNQTVTVTIKTNEKIQQVDGWKLQEDGMTLSKVYNANIKEEIIVYDLAGNGTIQEIEISNIVENDTTVSETVIPEAGLNMLVGASIIFVAVIVIVLWKKYTNMKDIK